MPTGEALNELAHMFSLGVAVAVATTDDAGEATIDRGWGPSVSEDGRIVVSLSAPIGSAVRSNLVPGAWMALNLVDPTTYRSMQVRGQVVRIDAPSTDDLARVDDHVARFAASAASVGLPDCECTLFGGLVTVEFSTGAAFDQTPGRNAGEPWG